MKIESTVNQERHEAILNVWVEKERFEQAKRHAAREIAKDVSIPGFRPGKAPYEVLVRFVGEEAILDKTLEMIVDEVYSTALEQANLKPGGKGVLEQFVVTPDKELQLTFLVPLPIRITLPEDYHQLRIPLPEMGEKEMEDLIAQVRRFFASFEKVEREVQWGDSVEVEIDSEGERSTTHFYLDPLLEKTEEGNEILHSLIGRKTGEEYEFIKKEGEKEVPQRIKVLTVYSVSLPTLEEVARMNGVSEEEYRQQMREFLESEARLEHGEKVLDELSARSRIAYPQRMLEEFVQEILEWIKQGVEDSGLSWESFLKRNQISEEEYAEQRLIPIIKKDFERKLVIEEIANREGIVLDSSMIENKLTQILAEYESRDPQRFKKLLKDRSFLQGVIYKAEDQALEEAVQIFLSKLASGELESQEQQAVGAEMTEVQQSEQDVEGVSLVAQEGEPSQLSPSTEDDHQ